MQIVYMTGQPRFFEFAIADSLEAVPDGATVVAKSSADGMVEQLDEHLFASMTDEEFFTFREVVQQAARSEDKQRAASSRTTTNPVRRFFRSFFRLVAEEELKPTEQPSRNGLPKMIERPVVEFR